MTIAVLSGGPNGTLAWSSLATWCSSVRAMYRSVASCPVMYWATGSDASLLREVAGILLRAMSVMSSRAAWAIPTATAANSEPKRASSGRWSSGCLATAGSSAKVPVHSSGMNRSLTTMSLLAVPLSPLTCQTSSICTSRAGTTPSLVAGTPPGCSPSSTPWMQM